MYLVISPQNIYFMTILKIYFFSMMFKEMHRIKGVNLKVPQIPNTIAI